MLYVSLNRKQYDQQDATNAIPKLLSQLPVLRKNTIGINDCSIKYIFASFLETVKDSLYIHSSFQTYKFVIVECK